MPVSIITSAISVFAVTIACRNDIHIAGVSADLAKRGQP
jgi:hypothetical protein